MSKGFKQLKGVRVLLSLPPRDTKGIELSPELKEELDRYSTERIEKIKDTLKYVYPKLSDEIDTYDKMKVLYEYSKL